MAKKPPVGMPKKKMSWDEFSEWFKRSEQGGAIRMQARPGDFNKTATAQDRRNDQTAKLAQDWLLRSVKRENNTARGAYAQYPLPSAKNALKILMYKKNAKGKGGRMVGVNAFRPETNPLVHKAGTSTGAIIN